MANKRIPDNVLQLRGTYRKDRHGDPETKVVLPDKMPTCPRTLDDTAKKEWRRVCRIFKGKKVLTEADSGLLEAYCILFSRLRNGPATITAAEITQFRMCASELGLTPVSRSKLAVPDNKKKSGNKYADLSL